MTTINIHELTPSIAEAVKHALAGEEVFITDDGKPLAKITSVSIPENKGDSQMPKRQGGFLKGKIRKSEDWDSQQTNDEIAREFGMLD